METHSRKRFREEENLDQSKNDMLGSLHLSCAISDKGRKTHAIPALVTEIFLNTLKDVHLLKTCRLVSKSWHIPASESLRTCSIVRLKESCVSKLTAFTNVLVRRSFGSLQNLPSPFQSFHTEGVTFTDPTFINLTLMPNIAITSLSMTLSLLHPTLDQSKLHRVIAANESTITDLFISANDNPFLHLAEPNPLLANGAINLTALKHLKFHDRCDKKQCRHILFMKNILRKCEPESLNLDIEKGRLLISLLPLDKAKNLKHLTIKMDTISTKTWQHLHKLKFSRLKTFKFECDACILEYDLAEFLTFFDNVTPVVEDFTTNIWLSPASELMFFKLKTINVQNNTVMTHFTPDKFPSLSKVCYQIDFPLVDTEVTTRFAPLPHPGVQFVVITANELETENEWWDQKHLLMFLTYLSRQFPNVTSFEYFTWKFHFTTFADIWESFPRLKTLRLFGDCNFICFSGMSDTLVTRYLQQGWPIEEIPRRKSIIDFMDLECIVFGPRFVLCPDMIVHCLTRVRKLKHIEFHWNEFLSAPLLWDSVGHLDKIVILNSSERKFQSAMAQVSKFLPNALLK